MQSDINEGRKMRYHVRQIIILTQPELTCWDPKDGELCLNRDEARGNSGGGSCSGSDVQIDRQIWV